MQRPRVTQPIRFWMTGAIAVVMAALAGGRVNAATERQMLPRFTPYTVSQTAQRIEAKAREHGLSVFLRVKQPAAPFPGRESDTLVLVFESSQGGTPIVMEGEGAEMRSELPLSLELRAHSDGSSEVRFPNSGSTDLSQLPPGLAADLAELPSLVADAIA